MRGTGFRCAFLQTSAVHVCIFCSMSPTRLFPIGIASGVLQGNLSRDDNNADLDDIIGYTQDGESSKQQILG